MDLRKIGVALIFIGIILAIFFLGNDKVFVPALTVTVLGFFLTVVGFVIEIRKRRLICLHINIRQYKKSDVECFIQNENKF